MTQKRTSILPTEQTFANIKGPNELDLEAICIFIATGFFMDSDTYWKNKVCLAPGSDHKYDQDGYLINSTPWFNWHHTPDNLSFEQALEVYIELLKTITVDQLQNEEVILPLSGGLDSRSQALILKELRYPVQSYSYEFAHGYNETEIAQRIAKTCGFRFEAFKIEKGYLWDCIDDLANINGCYSEFTHPRQMAILAQLKAMKGRFQLGHWGDVFFDRGAPEGIKLNQLKAYIFKTMVKKDGLQLANDCWKHWGLNGQFEAYLNARIESSLDSIQIENVSAKMRAYKTRQWAHRWTTTNLSIFSAAHPITLPYYDDRMCELVCALPEPYLADRQLQIAHLKTNRSLSKITWQAQRPYNIDTYRKNKSPYNLPFRIVDKMKREINTIMGQPYIQRNFELQFMGDRNERQLKYHVFNPSFNHFISKSIISGVYDKFKSKDYVQHSHSMSMLLTLSLWYQHFKKN